MPPPSASRPRAWRRCWTARRDDDALRILKEEQLYDAVLARLAERIEFHLAHKCGEMAAGAIVFSKEYGLLCRTSRAQELLGTIMEG